MPSLSRRSVGSALLAAGLCLAAGPAPAQAPEPFYKGRQITLLVFSGAGSTYDTYARLLARHMGNHIPGKPSFVIQYIVGAGGLKTVDYLNRIAPRDGTVFGTIGRGLAFEPMLGKNEVNFDPLKFTWIGSMNREASLALSWGSSPVKTLEDLRAMELLVPGTGAGADSEILPRAFNNLAGTRFRVISGYRDTSEASLQLETGELQGIAYWSWSAIMTARPDWVRDRKVNLLFHTGVGDIAAAPGVPRIRDRVADPIDRKALEFLLAREILGRPFLAPPGLPAERAETLRAAFNAALRDPAFLLDAERGNIETDVVTAGEVEAVLRDAANAPPAVLSRVKKILDR